MRCLVPFVALIFAGCAANDTLEPPDERILEYYRKDKNVVQKWKPTDALPTQLGDIGFSERFEEVYFSIWTDGGSEGLLFRDEQGVFFAFCIAFPRYWDGKKVVEVSRRTYFAGAMHPSEEGARVVPAGSPAEQFLESLLKEKSKKANKRTTDNSGAPPLRV